MVQRIERRVFYRYGVNSGWWYQRWPEFEVSYDALQRQVEQETMGPVDIEKREFRVVEYGDWQGEET